MGGRNISVFAYIENEKKEILLVENLEENHPDGGFTKPAGWGLPGGHVEANETDIEGLIREIFKETGIESKYLEVDLFDCHIETKRNREGEGIHRVMIMRVYLKVKSEKIILKPTELDIKQARWEAKDKIPPTIYKSHLARIKLFSPEAKVGY